MLVPLTHLVYETLFDYTVCNGSRFFTLWAR